MLTNMWKIEYNNGRQLSIISCWKEEDAIRIAKSITTDGTAIPPEATVTAEKRGHSMQWEYDKSYLPVRIVSGHEA